MATVKCTTKGVSSIKSLILNPALTSHYQVIISKPSNDAGFDGFLKKIGGEYGAAGSFTRERLNLSCCEASLPGSQLATSEIINDFYGVTERHVYRRQFDDRIDLNFYCDAEQYLPIRFFEAWMNYITNTDVDQGIENENYSYRMKFPSKYKAPLEVTKFEKNIESNNQVKPLTYRFVNAFPLAISSMPVTYDSSDLLKCNVSFAYSRYYIDIGTSTAEFTTPSAQSNYNNISNGFPVGGIPRLPSMRSGQGDPTLGMNDLVGTRSGSA
tara:strand:- start:9346 stop:10152 length:807 start_codon:yes stop_codon:yes gene_type:complete